MLQIGYNMSLFIIYNTFIIKLFSLEANILWTGGNYKIKLLILTFIFIPISQNLGQNLRLKKAGLSDKLLEITI